MLCQWTNAKPSECQGGKPREVSVNGTLEQEGLCSVKLNRFLYCIIYHSISYNVKCDSPRWG